MSTLFNRVAIIGVGLIGGSLALAMKKHNLCQSITGYGRNEDELVLAVELNVIDDFALSIPEVVHQADLIIIAVPMQAFDNVFYELAKVVDKSTIITDVGSAKKSVIEAAKSAFGGIPTGLVPGHPIAGTEKSGVKASFDSLFVNRRTILTPTSDTSLDAIRKVEKLWESVGAEVIKMDADHHDHVLAATSHLPHVLAFSLVETLGLMNEHTEIFRFAAGGFRDFSRIASSDPAMWRDICLSNKSAILNVLKEYEVHLKKLEQAIENNNAEELYATFCRAKTARDENVIA